VKVLIIFSYKWGFYFALQGIKKHSRNSIDFASYNSVTFKKAIEYDTIYILNHLCWHTIEKRWGQRLSKELTESKNVILGIGSKKNTVAALKTINRVNFRYIRVASQYIKNYLDSKTNLQNVKVVQNGVDTSIFKPHVISRKGFTVGWAGKYGRAEKRTHLLERLGYPLKIGVNLDYFKMPDFYNSVDVYVCVSVAESTPMPVLEAMSCGLPVVSTDVGIVPEALQREWIIPAISEEKVVEITKKKLKELKTDDNLRKKVGERNLEEIRCRWSSKARAKDWDRLFEG